MLMGQPQSFRGGALASAMTPPPPQQASGGSILDRFKDFTSPDIAAALLSGGTPAESFANMFGVIGKNRQRDKAKSLIEGQFPDLAPFVDAGASVEDVLGVAMKKNMLLKPGATDEYKQRAEAAIAYGMKPGTPEFQQFVLGNKFPDAGSGNLTDDIKEWQFAVQNGYKGTFTDWQTKSQRDQDPTFMREHTLRDEYDTDPNVKNFKAVRDNYKRVRSSATMDTGAGDVSLIFAYMKMLDPGSVVREGEFATAQNTGGIDDTIRNLYNGVVNGQRLTPEQRAKFVSAADQLYQGAVGTLTDTNKRFGDIAGGWQLDPGRIIQQPDKFEPLSLGVGQSKDAGGGVTIKRLE